MSTSAFPKPRIVTIIQARMGSTRLPGKVLLDIGGASMLARVVNRARRAALVDETVVATTDSADDDAVAKACSPLGVACFRGSVDDVLDRYYQAALAHRADAVVRITADCPAIDPQLIDDAVRLYLDHQPDYVSNGVEGRYPRGLDVEVVSMEALAKTWREARPGYERIHVTPYLYDPANDFDVMFAAWDDDYSEYRWTVDTENDLALIRAIYDRFDNADTFTWRDMVALMRSDPLLAALNATEHQKPLEAG
ncbi:MAG: glycosyltransferase family protein [Candidatus Hydrogenedentales bacterium]|jgi:spore coat polysaccharide biosynthesis protein SpsF